MTQAATCKSVLEYDPQAWQRATRHPFLDACANASISPAQFNTWLSQDRIFARDFVRLLARTLLAAPIHHLDTLLGGLAAMQGELRWFEEKAKQRGLPSGVEPQPACTKYRNLMEGLSKLPYAVLATAVWAIEYSYNEAWRNAQPMKAPYDEFADRWGSAEFSEYVKALERQADEALAEATTDTKIKAFNICWWISEYEVDFWNMAFENS